MAKAPPFWQISAYWGLLADPYIERTPFEKKGKLTHSAIIADYIFDRVLVQVKEKGLESTGLSQFSAEDIEKLHLVHKIIKDCALLASTAEEIENVEQFSEFVQNLIERISGLSVNGYVLIPGGWVGKLNQGVILYLVQKIDEDNYSFIICNSGKGLEYHPSSVCEEDNNPLKIKYKTALRLDNIPLVRITDIAFWSYLCRLWIKANPPSEFARVEIIYDVLLPWIATNEDEGKSGFSLQEAISFGDPYAKWGTPQRANTSFWKSFSTAYQYILRSVELSEQHLKQLTFVIKREFLAKSLQDLVKMGNKYIPESTMEKIKSSGFMDYISPSVEEYLQQSAPKSDDITLNTILEILPDELRRNDGTLVTKETLKGNTIGLYFSAHWCPPCRGFTPILASTYSKIAQNSKSFEIVFISSDQSQQEYDEYFQSMPWLSVPYGNAACQKLSRLLRISGIPSLILFNDKGVLFSRDGRKFIVDDQEGEKFPWNNSITFQDILSILTEPVIAPCNQHSKQYYKEFGIEEEIVVEEKNQNVEENSESKKEEKEEEVEKKIEDSPEIVCDGDVCRIVDSEKTIPVEEQALEDPNKCEKKEDQVQEEKKEEVLFDPSVVSALSDDSESEPKRTEVITNFDDQAIGNMIQKLLQANAPKPKPEKIVGESLFSYTDAATLVGKTVGLVIYSQKFGDESLHYLKDFTYSMANQNKNFRVLFLFIDNTEQLFLFFSRFCKLWYVVNTMKNPEFRDQILSLVSKKQITETKFMLFNENGSLISENAIPSLMKDPKGLHFPWNDSLTISDLMPFFQTNLICKDKEITSEQLETTVQNRVTGVYFSASWCGPCQSFTPKLASVYQQLKQKGIDFEVIFVSFDRSEDSFEAYYSKMPWITMKYNSIDARKALSGKLKVNGIPKLFLFDENGFFISENGTQIISSDPTGSRFPWTGKESQAAYSEEDVNLLLVDQHLLRIGCEQYARNAIKEFNNGKISSSDIEKVHLQINTIDEVIQSFPRETTVGGIPPEFNTTQKAQSIPFPRGELLHLGGMEEYEGKDFEKKTPNLTDMFTSPEQVQSLSEAILEIEDTINICGELLTRARDGSTTSRKVLQYQTLCIISNLFLQRLPVPKPIDSNPEKCIWRNELLTEKVQLDLLKHIYKLLLHFGTVWQSIENPTREFDSEKTLVAYCGLAIFEVVVKTVASDTPLILSEVLVEDNYHLSNGICDDNRDFKLYCASVMEVVNPRYLSVRNDLLEYFDSVKRNSKEEILDLRMPASQNFELQRYSSTCIFLRKLIERYGYELIDPEDKNPPPEMKALCMWLTSMDFPLLRERAEFLYLRDTVILCKFLATTEPYEYELLRKRLNSEGAPRWHISFGDNSGANGHVYSTQTEPLYWELQNIRGPELDIGDLTIYGFGYRDMSYGEGLILQSPSSLKRLLSKPFVTEDDILHIDKLPTFNDVLSREESELLLSYLTVEYVRIPLVVTFFATQDRHMYLFVDKLQKLLRSVLFECGSWVSSSAVIPFTRIPIRMTKEQVELQMKVNLFHANAENQIQNSLELLSTPSGLLLNELRNSPAATLDPLLTIFDSILELQHSSVYSNDASYILYIIMLAIDVESYVNYAIEEKEQQNCITFLPELRNYSQLLYDYLHTTAVQFLCRWEQELLEFNDLPSLCVIHAYKALLWTNTPKELTAEIITEIYGNIAFVRNWHGFGKGENRSDMITDSSDNLDPEGRLTRFLQAHGINTKNMSKDSLAAYVNETNRPLFLHLGNRTVRIPTLHRKRIVKTSDLIRLPPADMPEHRLFSLIQQKRKLTIQWLEENLASDQKKIEGVKVINIDSVFNSIIEIALRSSQYNNCKWTSGETRNGLFKSDTQFLTLDVQSGEILWSNEELTPLPDTMTSYNDFQTFFSKEILHCATKSRKEHKHTVQIVGKNYSLSEWDPYDISDMGVGAPKLGDSMKTSCLTCGKLGVCWECHACGKLVCDDKVCTCGAPKRQTQIKEVTDCIFEGVQYNRAYDLYSQEPHPVESEAWIERIIKPILLHEYPPCNKLAYPLLLPKDIVPENENYARLMAFDPGDPRKRDSTWREYIVWKYQQCMFVYNLVSNGRRVYRSQIYSSIGRLSLHSLPPIAALDPTTCKPFNKFVLYAAGNIAQTTKVQSSLVIQRSTFDINSLEDKDETYIPPRLLQGVIPGILLESFHFWQGENMEIRGEPMDKSSQWFSYSLIINFNESKVPTFNIVRRPMTSSESSFEMEKSDSLKSSRSSDTEVDEAVQALRQSTGLSASLCRSALRASDNDLAQATEMLLNTQERENLRKSSSPVISIRNQFTAPQLGRLHVLEEEGFSRNASKYALLMFFGDVDLARSWLLDEVNEQQILSLSSLSEDDEVLHNSGRLSDSGILRASINNSPELDLDLHLINVLDLDADNEIFKLVTLLTRLEDVSHLLIWGKRINTKQNGVNEYAISIIELPRLKVKFQPKKDNDGVVRLYLLDHSGWFVSSINLKSDRKDLILLNDLLKGIEHCIVLENSAKEYQAMVVNHDLYRPTIQEDFFAVKLVGDNASLGWQQVMDSRYYLYSIHTSKCFLMPNSLSASLYLLLLRLMNKDYKESFELIESCYVDTPFTPEEKWVYDQFIRVKDDMHPDAHACKIKLSIAVSFNKSKLPWELHEELTKYIQKIEHVSSFCKLTEEEELEASHLCASGTRTIRNRRAFLLAVKNNLREVELKGELIKIGGNPWIVQSQYSQDYLQGSETISRVQFISPSRTAFIEENDMHNLIWNDFILHDSEGGTDRKLGFLFLYQLLRGKYKVLSNGRDFSSSFGEILSRAFQLKLVRFGKEPDVNDRELIASVHMSQLSALLQNPYFPWPEVPSDDRTMGLLHRGIYLYSGPAVNTDIRFFFNSLANCFQSYMESDTRYIFYEKLTGIVQIIRSLYPIHSKTFEIQPFYDNYTRDHARVIINNTRCEKQSIDIQRLSAEYEGISKCDLESFVKRPLSPIDLSKFISWQDSNKETLSSLPFDLSSHPSSHTLVAEDMIERLQEDLRYYSKKEAISKTPVFHHLSSLNIQDYAEDPSNPSIDLAITKLEELIVSLDQLQCKDSQLNSTLLHEICEKVNTITLNQGEDNVSKVLFLISRYCGIKEKASPKLLLKLLLSSEAERDVMLLNPYVDKSQIGHFIESASIILFYSNRISHSNRVISLAKSLVDMLKQLQKTAQRFQLNKSLRSSTVTMSQSISVAERIVHTTSDLCQLLVCSRSYVDQADKENIFEYDPRFLMFEYLFDIMLRGRQVEMVRWFINNVRNRESRVQQMIMGAGKTTVVGPLLALILADGASLVTQVMPTALLEQTRNIMRSRFSVIITKRIFTLKFDRSCEVNVELVAEVFSKLDSARRHQSIICSSPEAIKSLYLKFVEQLHSVERYSYPNSSLSEFEQIFDHKSSFSRKFKEESQMYDKIVQRSEMADHLVKILDLWKQGILIMDEVDVLLHPLRSELNFPIGHKNAIDMAGLRWDLPIHLINAIFSAQSLAQNITSTTDPTAEVTSIPDLDEPSQILKNLASVIQMGYERHTLQRNPHLILLDVFFYHKHMRELLAKWALLWLHKHFIGSVSVSNSILLDYLQGINIEDHRNAIENGLLPESKKLLNLASNWIKSLLPHVISKINRVSYGILNPSDLSFIDIERTPRSRLLMAVPFIGKDVPSRSSEFAHPDALIGLTILAYRYEGVRKSDLLSIVSQLKRDYSQQIGPRDQRPASILFQYWLTLCKSNLRLSLSHSNASNAAAYQAVLPLALFQPTDEKQLSELYSMVKYLPQLIHYYLAQHIFPSCMNFQEIKLSACGHELGSNILFDKRIGFSGTPSNLLPVDLGKCEYEPGSDGSIINVLTSPLVTTASIKVNWSAKSLLRDIAQAEPSFHALIDTGALITGMDNEEVAHYLLLHLPEWMEGVVYLDRQDRQMILLRSSGRSIHLNQCGISPDRRFTFYDQIHTTGMDIKQMPSARAVVTIGKDMTFRDYAQGSYRMRGIGKGQTIHLYIIPEVQNRILEELNTSSGMMQMSGLPELDVPAWLLINSMRMESVQFVQLSQQELQNIWRKTAYFSLVTEIHANRPSQNPDQRVKRFRPISDDEQSESEWLRKCINLYREPITFEIEDHVPVPFDYLTKMNRIVEEHNDFNTGHNLNLVNDLLHRVKQVSDKQAMEALAAYKSEMLHEQEAEEEQEVLLEEEEEQESMFTRDDEQHNPWDISVLSSPPSFSKQQQEEEEEEKLKIFGAFYRFSSFQVRDTQPKLTFPQSILLTDNFFRPTWIGLGDRRLKNSILFTVWIPSAEQPENHFIVALSLAEGESIRRLIHYIAERDMTVTYSLALINIQGSTLDKTSNFNAAINDHLKYAIKSGIQCFRFFNGEMFYNDEELQMLEKSLERSDIDDRLAFYLECLRLRRRQRNVWADTPIARIFTHSDQWNLIKHKSKAMKLSAAILRRMKKQKVDPFILFDENQSLKYNQVVNFLDSMRIAGFALVDYFDIIKFVDANNHGEITIKQLRDVLNVPHMSFEDNSSNSAEVVDNGMDAFFPDDTWSCEICTAFNPTSNSVCEVCQIGNCPADKLKAGDDFSFLPPTPEGMWMCMEDTFFNPNTEFYCEMCNKARPDLADVRF